MFSPEAGTANVCPTASPDRLHAEAVRGRTRTEEARVPDRHGGSENTRVAAGSRSTAAASSSYEPQDDAEVFAEQYLADHGELAGRPRSFGISRRLNLPEVDADNL